ncbi:MBL fold metallo-hydrolase [Paenibacillus sp. y28]|uniref:MBL fold metallo-hydrolase n=1 Tax=Paenibacillus sp. y28 TaxID=3129110 RepID=UPI003016B0CA
MLGTGSAFAKKYFNNNALVSYNGFRLLIDLGVTGSLSLHQLGIGMDKIDAVLITHLHADHIGGLEEYAYQMKFVYGRKPRLYVPDVLIRPLWENSLRGGLEHDTEGPQTMSDYFEVIPVYPGTPVAFRGGLTVEAVRTTHVPGKPSFSLFLNGSIFYSCDIIFDRSLLQHVHQERACHTILHDCQLSSPGVVHASLDELLTLPDELQEKIWLMHYGDTMEAFIGKTGKMRFLRQHEAYTFP